VRHLLDLQQAPLGRHAARRRETAELAAGREHAMARDDDRKRIAAQRLPDVAREQPIAEARRNLSVGQRVTRGNRARDFVDTLFEGLDGVHVQAHIREVDGRAVEQRADALDRPDDLRRRLAVKAVGETAAQTRPDARGVRFGQLESHDTARIPGDAAVADGRVEHTVRERHERSGR